MTPQPQKKDCIHFNMCYHYEDCPTDCPEYISHSSITTASAVLEKVYNRLNTLYETVEHRGHYRRVLLDADIECLFAELRQQQKEHQP